jgi:hypothetical protein
VSVTVELSGRGRVGRMSSGGVRAACFTLAAPRGALDACDIPPYAERRRPIMQFEHLGRVRASTRAPLWRRRP